MNVGDKVNLKNGCSGTVTQLGLGDFVGDPRVVYIQYLDKDNKVQIEILTEDHFVRSNTDVKSNKRTG